MAGITSTKKIKGQPHLLAYITPSEAKTLENLGGQKTMTPEGIPAYPPPGEIGGAGPTFKEQAQAKTTNNSPSNDGGSDAREAYIRDYVSKGIVKGGGTKVKVPDHITGGPTWENAAPSASAMQAAKQFQEEQAFKKATQTWDKNTNTWKPKKSNFFTSYLYNRIPNNPKNELAFLRQLKAAGHYIPSELEELLEAQDAERRLGLDYNKKFTADQFAMLKALQPKGSLDFSQYMLVGDPNRAVRPNPGLFMRGNLGNFYSQPQPDWWDSAVHGNWEQHKNKIIQDMGLSTGGNDNQQYTAGGDPGDPGDPGDGDDDGDGDGGGGDPGSGVVYPYANYGTPGYQTSDTFMNLAYPGGRDFLLARGGRVPAAFGGIMDSRTGRRAYGLGSIFKGVKKAIGKVLGSDIGKAALGIGAFMYGPKLFGASKLGGFGGWGQAIPKEGMMAKLFRKNIAEKGKDFLGGDISPWKTFTTLSPLVAFTDLAKAKQDRLLGDGKRGGHLIDPLTNKEALPNEMRANLNDALSAAWNEDKQAYESEAMAAIKQAYPFLGQYPIYKVKDGGRIGYAGGGLPSYAQGGRIPAQEGGLMDLGGLEKDYRNEGGFVPIGREERADDVPARLSVNEFVFTADAVRNAGGGDIDKGAEIMENMMKNLENGGRISEESQGNTGAQEMFSVSERIGEVI